MRVSRRHLMASGLAAAFCGRPVAAEEELGPVLASDVFEVPYKFRRQDVEFETAEQPGTIIVDTKKRWLYHVQGEGRATRYGVGIGTKGKGWSGEAVVRRKVKWPAWRPTPEHLASYPSLAKYEGQAMPGGAGNPLGARALYLFQGEVDMLYRIHGTIKPSGIGRKVTSGCLQMLNIDVVHLYDRVDIGTHVIVLPA